MSGRDPVRTAWTVGLVVVLLCAAFWGVLMYGELYAQSPRDVLTRRLCTPYKCSAYNGWGWSHLLLYVGFGLILPDHYLAFGAVGVAWESWEYLLSVTRCTQWDPVPSRCRPGEQPGDWWYAKFSDLVFNMVGYTVGSVAGNAIRGRPLLPEVF